MGCLFLTMDDRSEATVIAACVVPPDWCRGLSCRALGHRDRQRRGLPEITSAGGDDG